MSNRTFIVMGVDQDAIHPMRTPGFVYFVRAVMGGLIKIGWASNPTVRLHNMQMVCPIKLEILLAVPANGALEKALHLKFAAQRTHGEWFEPSDELHALIATWREAPPPRPAWPAPRKEAERLEFQGPPTREWDGMMRCAQALEIGPDSLYTPLR